MAAVRVSGTVTNDDQRAYIKIEKLRGKTPTEIHSSLMEVCGVETVDRSTISGWAESFREGRLSIENDPKSGRLRTSTDDQNVERVLQILEEDRRMTCEEIAYSAGISRTSAYRILTGRLHKSRIAARWVPYDLSEEQMCRRLEIAQQLLHRFREEGNEFLQKVGAIDKTWIRDFEPELKSQSSEWRGKSSPRPKKFKRAQSNMKQMMIVMYDCKGVIMTDRVPSGMTVTAAYYHQYLQKLRRKMHVNRPHLLENGVLILHDNTRPHLGKDVRELLDGYSWEALPHPPYSPDMSPPYFDLFPKLKINMRGARFSMLKDLSASVTRRVRQLNCSRDVTGIMDLPKRWDAVIQQKGDYTEGL